MVAIEIQNLSKNFNRRNAVDSLNLTINKGELFALLGQNGAGKTTTIKMLCGLLIPTDGDAVLLGNSIINNPFKLKQLINISPQETAIAPKLSVRENLVLIAQLYGYDHNKAGKQADGLLETFGLEKRANDRAKTLSGGLQRRLSIAMAMISDPSILFLDEPTLGLDVRARRDLWKYINSLKGDKTIILTTHYLEEAESLADRIAIMERGKLKVIGTADEIKHQTGTDSLEEAFLSVTEEEE